MARNPRINVAVTEEQHSLLLELAELQGGSAAGYLRQQLDLSTPLLRAAVPLLRRAAEETSVAKNQASALLQEPMRLMKEMGIFDQLDLIDDTELGARATVRSAASGASETERSERSGADGIKQI